LDRDDLRADGKQLGVVEELTEIVAAAAGDPSLRERAWVLSARAALAGDDVAGRMSTGVASATRSSRARRPTVSTGAVA
jgi:hypothetical protein